jgi:hypothetical protein
MGGRGGIRGGTRLAAGGAAHRKALRAFDFMSRLKPRSTRRLELKFWGRSEQRPCEASAAAKSRRDALRLRSGQAGATLAAICRGACGAGRSKQRPNERQRREALPRLRSGRVSRGGSMSRLPGLSSGQVQPRSTNRREIVRLRLCPRRKKTCCDNGSASERASRGLVMSELKLRPPKHRAKGRVSNGSA